MTPQYGRSLVLVLVVRVDIVVVSYKAMTPYCGRSTDVQYKYYLSYITQYHSSVIKFENFVYRLQINIDTKLKFSNYIYLTSINKIFKIWSRLSDLSNVGEIYIFMHESISQLWKMLGYENELFMFS